MILVGIIAEEKVSGGGGGGGVPALIAHVAVQAASFSQPGPSGAIDTTGANFLVMAINAYDNNYGHPSLVADNFGSAPVAVGISSCSYGGSTLTLNGSFPSGGSNAYAGKQFAVAGFQVVTANNGYWMCTASTTGSIDLTVPSGASSSTSGVYVALSVNSWSLAFVENTYGGVAVWYCANATVGASHYFLEDDRPVAGAGDGSSFAVAAFSNIATSSPFVGDGPGTDIYTGTTAQAPSYNPAQANNLILSATGGLNVTGGYSVDSSFTITDQEGATSRYNPVALAYLIAPSTSALAPTWTVASIGNRFRADICEFKHS